MGFCKHIHLQLKSLFKLLLLKDGKVLYKNPSEIIARTNILTPLQEWDIPNAREAKAFYERVYSRRLTEENPFGKDPLGENLMPTFCSIPKILL